MHRRNPVFLTLLIVLTIGGLVLFSRSFEASKTLDSVQRVSEDQLHRPVDAPDAGHGGSNAHGGSGGAHGASGDSSSSVHDAHGVPVAPEADRSSEQPDKTADLESKNKAEEDSGFTVDGLAGGKPIMGKMPNMTVRAQVGNAGWKLLHTILSQYPEEPTSEQRATLETFIKFFSRVYPCNECATHFQELLREYPPQLGSRKNAVMWGCNAHNVVNRRLEKPEYDCTRIFDEYDCGCGDQPSGTPSGTPSGIHSGIHSGTPKAPAKSNVKADKSEPEIDHEKTHSVEVGKGG